MRLSEDQPSEKSAQIAVLVVDLIIEDTIAARQASLGLTAEQIVSKVRRDENSLVILKHLLRDVPEQQRERLLLEAIPAAYFSLLPPEDEQESGAAIRLREAHRILFDSVSEGLRQKATAEFTRILREEDGTQVSLYRDAFFKAADLQYVSPNRAAMVREHLLRLVPSKHDIGTLHFVDGIAPYLEPSEVQTWLDPFVRTLVSPAVSDRVKDQVKTALLDASFLTTDACNKRVDERFDAWISLYEKQPSAAETAAVIRALKKDMGEMRIPF